MNSTKSYVNKLTQYPTNKIFDRLINNKSTNNYLNYISELRKRKTKEIYERCLTLINGDSDKEKIIGIDVISQFGFNPRLFQKRTLKIYFDLLKTETNKRVIESILFGISWNNENITNQQLDILCSFVTHKSAYVRYSLTYTLCRIEKDKAIDTLIKLSTDRDVDIRDYATFGLGSQFELDTSKIRTALWDRVKDKDQGVRLEAISGLAQRKDKNISEILKKEFSSIPYHNLSHVLECIEHLNDKSFIPILENKKYENKDQSISEIEKKWVLATLGKLKSNKNNI